MSSELDAALCALYAAEARRLRLMPRELGGEYLRPVFGRGSVNALLMLIGEAPGAQETLQGCPFVGKAGQQLDALLGEVGLPREKLFITNAVKYRPYRVHPVRGSFSNRPPTRKEVLASAPLLLAEIAHVKPRVVATLGNTPLLALLGRALVGEMHGRAVECDGYTLLPLYHPASVIYNRALAPVLERDMHTLWHLLQHAAADA